MRYLLYSLFLLLWIVFWWWRYTCPIKQTCCTPGTDQAMSQTEIVEIEKEDNRPILFRWSDQTLIVNRDIGLVVDSLVELLNDQDQIEITGLYFRDEANPTGYADLGLARAASMRDVFFSKLDTTRIKLKSTLADIDGDVRNKMFEALVFRKIINNDFIKEIDDMVLIYFPFNSTKRLDNPTITSYLQQVADRVKVTGERVELTGHTDSEGANESNYYLGLWRAGAIRDILVDEKGLPESSVLVKSRGELEPLGSNNTFEGRKRNRRVELKLIR